jgi:uncharacterized membrane protein
MKETKKRSMVKAAGYRMWTIFSTYVLLLVTGQAMDQAIVPTIIINVIWTVTYYYYDRLWMRIDWGRTK